MPAKDKDPERERGPEALGEILGRLFIARGWGRQQGRARLERVWAEVAGPHAAHTAVLRLVRGVLEISVDSAVLLSELTHFHKRRLLQQMQAHLPGVTLNDLRFRAGTVKPPGNKRNDP